VVKKEGGDEKTASLTMAGGGAVRFEEDVRRGVDLGSAKGGQFDRAQKSLCDSQSYCGSENRVNRLHDESRSGTGGEYDRHAQNRTMLSRRVYFFGEKKGEEQC